MCRSLSSQDVFLGALGRGALRGGCAGEERASTTGGKGAAGVWDGASGTAGVWAATGAKGGACDGLSSLCCSRSSCSGAGGTSLASTSKPLSASGSSDSLELSGIGGMTSARGPSSSRLPGLRSSTMGSVVMVGDSRPSAGASSPLGSRAPNAEGTTSPGPNPLRGQLPVRSAVGDSDRGGVLDKLAVAGAAAEGGDDAAPTEVSSPPQLLLAHVSAAVSGISLVVVAASFASPTRPR